jgi:hypothetical protein
MHRRATFSRKDALFATKSEAFNRELNGTDKAFVVIVGYGKFK